MDGLTFSDRQWLIYMFKELSDKQNRSMLNDVQLLSRFETCKSRAKILKLTLKMYSDGIEVYLVKTRIAKFVTVEELDAFLIGFKLGQEQEKI